MKNSPSQQPYIFSQAYEIVPPKKVKHYPIATDEWKFLKSKIRTIKIKPNWYYNSGYTLIGGALSFLGIILTGNGLTVNTKFVCWCIFAVCLFCGIVCFFVGRDTNKNQSDIASDIVSQMDNIENRYE